MISVQVLNELANVAHRKMRMSWRETNTFLSLLRGLLTVHSLEVETHETGLALAERYNLSIYDAMIVACLLYTSAPSRAAKRLAKMKPSSRSITPPCPGIN